MNEDEKRQVGIFRFGVIHDFVSGVTMDRGEQERLLREITARVRNSADVDSVMRTAAQEVGRALGRQTFIYLGDHEDEIPFDPVEET